MAPIVLLLAAVTGPVAHAAVTADLGISADGSALSGWGATETYRWIVTNQGPDAVDGVGVVLAVSSGILQQTSLSCGATGGAECPAFTADADGSLSGTTTTIPAGGTLTVTVEVTMPSSGTSVRVSGSLVPTSGVTDLDPRNDVAVVTTTLSGSLSVDIQVSNTGPALGAQYVWSIVVTNVGSSTLSGVTLSDEYREYQGSGLTTSWDAPICVPSGGAVCPTGFAAGSASGDAWVLAGLTATLPPSGALRINVRATTTASAPTCDGRLVILNVAQARVGGRTWSSIRSVSPYMLCSRLVVTTSPATVSPRLNTPYMWTDTFENRGLTEITDARLTASLRGVGVETAWSEPVCTSAGGASCPTGFSSGATTLNASVYDVRAPSIPPLGSLTITYTMTHADPVPVCGDSYGVGTTVVAAGDNLTTSDAPGVAWPTQLTDAAVEARVSQVQAGGRQPLTLTVLVGSLCGTIHTLPFTWTLPATSGFDVANPLVGMVCRASWGTCPSFTFDPATRTLSTVFTEVGPNRFTMTLQGVSGIQPGAVWASSTALANPLDLNSANDTSIVYFRVSNPVWRLEVGIALSPDSMLSPTEIVFSGVLRCIAAGDIPWRLTLRAGDNQAFARVSDGWAGDSCTFVADDLPVAPPGYRWSAGLTGVGTYLGSVQAAHQAHYTATLVAEPVVVLPPVIVLPPVGVAPAVRDELGAAEATAAAPVTGLASTGAPLDGAWMVFTGGAVVLGFAVTFNASRSRSFAGRSRDLARIARTDMKRSGS